MGVQEMPKCIRENMTVTNFTLKNLLELSPTKHSVGVDMSIIIVSSILASPNIIYHLFAKPDHPIDALTTKVVDFLNIFHKNGFITYCVFDGLAHKLKRDVANKSRYWNSSLN